MRDRTALWSVRKLGTPWRVIHLAVVAMALQMAVTLVIGYALLDDILIFPVAFTAVTTTLAFAIAYWTDADHLDVIDPPANAESLPELIRGLETSLGIPVRRTYITECDTPRAEIRPLAFHRTEDLYLTTGLITQLDADELTAIIAHELSHVKYHDHHYRTYSAVVELTAISVAATIATWSIYTTLPTLFLPGTSVVTGIIGIGEAFGIAGVVWYSGRGVAGKYRQTAEYIADQRAGALVSYMAMQRALRAITPADLVGPSPGLLEQLTADYPSLTDRLTQLHIHHTNTQPKNRS